jgi:hypothetical protein
MDVWHPQENIIETFDYNGVTIEVVGWRDTVWCGKVGYATDNVGEPDVGEIMDGFMALNVPSVVASGREDGWDACISLNYLSHERPNGVMIGFLVSDESQPKEFDLLKFPSALFMRIRMCDETAAALGHEPWHGGIPPYEWIGAQLAPMFGYKYGADTLPVIEYYGFYNPEKNAHEFCYLYVPVEKA